MAAVAPSPLDTANANSHILVNKLNMSDADWAAVSSDERKKKWWVCIKIAKPAAVVGNVAGKLSTLLKVFTNPLISRTGVLWMKHLHLKKNRGLRPRTPPLRGPAGGGSPRTPPAKRDFRQNHAYPPLFRKKNHSHNKPCPLPWLPSSLLSPYALPDRFAAPSSARAVEREASASATKRAVVASDAVFIALEMAATVGGGNLARRACAVSAP